MRALVTGGAGFIGSHLVDALVAAGVSVAAVDDLSTGREENVPAGVELCPADVSDAGAMLALFERLRPDWVFHLAAQIDVRRAVADPAHDARVNVAGTAAVLEAARAAGASRVVLASTGGAIYGDCDVVPTPESAPLAPLAPYGAGKAAAETYVDLYVRLHGLSGMSLRLANVYGPRQGRGGEGGVVSIYAEAAVAGEPATVFGDGTQTRDFVYVGDVVRAFLAAARSDATGVANVGTGRETSVLDLIDAFDLQPRFAPARPGEVQRSCLDATRASELLDWQPQVALTDGIRTTLDSVAAPTP